MTCEDCGGPVTNTAPEVVARQHGLQVCASCLQSYEDEADAYDAMMEEAGVRCEFDPSSGRFIQRQIEERCR